MVSIGDPNRLKDVQAQADKIKARDAASKASASAATSPTSITAPTDGGTVKTTDNTPLMKKWFGLGPTDESKKGAGGVLTYLTAHGTDQASIDKRNTEIADATKKQRDQNNALPHGPKGGATIPPFFTAPSPEKTSSVPTPAPGRVTKKTTVATPKRTVTATTTAPVPNARDARFRELQRQESSQKSMRGDGGNDARSRAATRLSAEESRAPSTRYRPGEATPKATRKSLKDTVHDFSGLKWFK